MEKNSNSVNPILLGVTFLSLTLATLCFLGIIPSYHPTTTTSDEVPCYSGYASEPFSPLTGSYAAQLITNYRDNQWSFINSAIKTGTSSSAASANYSAIDRANYADSRSVWFNLKTLKRFIYEIEKKSCDNNVAGELGIRFYYGQYPCDLTSNTEFNKINILFAGLHTLVMIPTYNDANDTPIDFDPARIDANGQPEPFSCDWATITALSPNLTMMNHGTLVPPPAKTEGTGADLMACIDQRITNLNTNSKQPRADSAAVGTTKD